MLDRWVRPERPAPSQPARPVLRPGDPDWRQRWLAGVRRRMQASLSLQDQMRTARMASLASDPALWAEIQSAEGAYGRGEGETFVPGQRPRDGADR
jgi:hypothetical protein